MCVVLAALAGWGAGVASADVTLEADTYVRSDTPSTNYGTTKEIRARGGGSLVINGLIRFRVQGVGAVGTAKLRVYVTDSSVGTGSVFKVLDNSWVENTIVWPGPAPTGSALDSEPAGPSTGSWVEFDVSSFVTGDGTYSFQLQNSVSDAVYYSSREGSNAPQLVLTTGGGTGTAPANQTAPSISGTTQVGQTLHADPGQWTGTGPITYGYQWQQCTSGTCTPISNAVQQDYTLSARRRGYDDSRAGDRDGRGCSAGGGDLVRGGSGHSGPANLADEHATARDHRHTAAGPDSAREPWSVVGDRADHLRVSVAALLWSDLHRHLEPESESPGLPAGLRRREPDDQGDGDRHGGSRAARHGNVRCGRAGGSIQRWRRCHAHDRRRHRV